ncbi:MAG TPA: hypothetical protein VMW29_02515 [Candidatus Bathyarchaeia archaeon]|nr:hypothetical protein [Candidatus Bathyarchaeia archaeon]
MSKKALMTIIIPLVSLLLGAGVFFVAKKYSPKMAEVFWTEPYDAGCTQDGQSCSSCNPDCRASGCDAYGSGSCSTTKTCVCQGGSCKIKQTNGLYSYQCTPHCPNNMQEGTSGIACTVTCNPCGNSITCTTTTPPPPSSPPPPPPSSPPPPPSSPPPGQSLVCTDLVRNPTTTLNIGDPVSFTCSHQLQNVTFDHYNYRYNIDNGAWQNPTEWQGIAGATPAFTLEQAGVYLVQCQVCSSDDNSHCTTWGQAEGWTQ